MIHKILREPLLHFLVLGVALFALFGLFGNRNDPQDRRIVISSGRIDQVVTIFARTWQRPPTVQELRGLIDDEIRDEILYREAVAMGLDKDDVIVRRRLRQKFEFLTEGAGVVATPSESDLQMWLDKNSERFRSSPKISFVQIFLNVRRRGDGEADAEAARVLAQLANAGDKMDISELGDTTMLPKELPLVASESIASIFGERFAQQLETLEVGRWSGPLPSSYGLHVVYVRDRTAGKPRALEEVRDEVRRAWIIEHQREQVEANYRKLREKYSVVVEPTPSQHRRTSASDVEPKVQNR